MRLERSIDVLLKETQSGNKSDFNPVFMNRQLDFSFNIGLLATTEFWNGTETKKLLAVV